MLAKMTRWPRGLLLRGWVLIASQWTHIVLFLTVNVILGALGFLVPISIEYAATDNFMPALRKQLDAAGAYTFAIAFLASCISLVAAEYLDMKEVAKYRNLKVLLCVVAGLIMIFCAVFSGSQTARSLIDETLRFAGNSVSHVQSVDNRRSDMQSDGIHQENKQSQTQSSQDNLSKLDGLQLQITFLAVVVGLALFLVFKYQAPDMQEQLKKITEETDNEASSLMLGLQVGRR